MHHHHSKDGYFTGIMLVAIGLIVLLDSLHVYDLGNIIGYWPLILVIFGIRKMIVGRSPRRFPKGAFTIFLGLWLFAAFNHLWGIRLVETWPAVLIGLGITMVWKGMYPKSPCRQEGPIVVP